MENMNEIFAQNLKVERLKAKLTQKELADKIAYSDKSLSKLENGKGVPSLEMLLALSDALEIDVNRLLRKRKEKHYYLGIDGGGTKTHFLLEDEAGSVVQELILGASNPIDIGMEQCKEILTKGIKSVCQGISLADVSVFAGLAGGTTGDNRQLIGAFMQEFGFGKVRNGTDMQNTLALGLGNDNGVILIMGTGIVAMAMKDGQRLQLAGWGQFFEKGGSGYCFGRDAIYSALCQLDHTGKETLISELLEKRLKGSVRSHLADFYKKGKHYIASFSDIVFEAAKQGDEVAIEIIEQNMRQVAKLIRAGVEFVGESPVRVEISGGVTAEREMLYPILEKYICCTGDYKIGTVFDAPVHGAIKIARGEVRDIFDSE